MKNKLIIGLLLLLNSCSNDWEFLQPQDKIDMIWPSGCLVIHKDFTQDDLFERIDHVVKTYVLSGVDCHKEDISVSDSIGDTYANSDEKRAEAFHKILHAPATKAIWVGKAGFGSSQILEIFEQRRLSLPMRKIPIIGFSDTTYLHLLAHVNKWPSLHAPMVNLLQETADIMGNPSMNKEANIVQLMGILKGEVREVEYTLDVLNPSILSHFPLSNILPTRVVGGNLSVILRNIGSSTALEPDGSIIFLEDTDEFFNRGRDHLTHLIRAGIFDHVHAIFFGDWTLKGIPLEDLIDDFDQTLRKRGIYVPILKASGFGHGPVNQVLPLGTKSTLQFTQDGKAILKCSVNQSAY